MQHGRMRAGGHDRPVTHIIGAVAKELRLDLDLNRPLGDTRLHNVARPREASRGCLRSPS
jgi:hypothetical protein